MSQPMILRFYLEESLLNSAIAQEHNFIGKIVNAARSAGFEVEYLPNTTAERAHAPGRDGFALFHMEEPTHDRALTFRRVYRYPFWAIEPSAKRWEWAVAKADFPGGQTTKQAQRFYSAWQNRIFGDAAQSTTRSGFVYVPLQGRLLSHRSFQYCTPIDMLIHVLDRDPDRQIIAALHPNETYSGAERAALQRLTETHKRLTIQTGGMETLLQNCDYVVTQNSGAAFSGYFFGKPSILFARIDFHHIAANVQDTGVDAAFDRVASMQPDYAGYIHWFWQTMSINAGRDDAEDKIRAAFDRAGWPIK